MIEPRDGEVNRVPGKERNGKTMARIEPGEAKGQGGFPIAAFLALAAAMLSGCQDRFDPAVYGRVVPKLPKIEGADEPYKLPELQEETTRDKADEEAQERAD
jgi:hypothetical protein